MNKKATLFLSIVTSVMFFLAGFILLNYVLPEVDTFRTAMDCNGNISDGGKLTCLGGDMLVPYLILLIVSIAAGRIADNIL